MALKLVISLGIIIASFYLYKNFRRSIFNQEKATVLANIEFRKEIVGEVTKDLMHGSYLIHDEIKRAVNFQVTLQVEREMINVDFNTFFTDYSDRLLNRKLSEEIKSTI